VVPNRVGPRSFGLAGQRNTHVQPEIQIAGLARKQNTIPFYSTFYLAPDRRVGVHRSDHLGALHPVLAHASHRLSPILLRRGLNGALKNFLLRACLEFFTLALFGSFYSIFSRKLVT
jgi:hypothetical protein